MIRKFAQLAILDAWCVAGGSRGLRKAAHRVSFDYTPRPGYLYVRARAISSRCNDNWDAFPAGEIEKGYRTFLGKPAFVNHHNSNHRRARGVIVAAAIHRDRNPDGSDDTWVELLHEIDAQTFPKFAKAILSGRINRTSMGVDCEYSTCSACGNRATSPAEYCVHMPSKKGMKYRKRNPKTGRLEEQVVHEICAGLTFFENSFLVEDPADPTAHVLDKPYLHPVTGARKAAAPDLLAYFAGRKEFFTAAVDLPEAACPNCGSPRARAHSPMHEMAQCSDCGTHYNHLTGREYTPEEVDVAHAAHANYEDYEEKRKAGEQLFGHVTDKYTHPMPGWDEAREWRDQAHREDLQPHPMSGTPLPQYPPRRLGDPELDEKRRRYHEDWARQRREHVTRAWSGYEEPRIDPTGRERLSVRQGATWTPDPEGSDWTESRDASALEKLGRDSPHGAAIQIAQQRTAFDHPNMHTQLPRPEDEGSYIFSETGGKVLAHMLQASGYRGDTSRAFVARHRDPSGATSNPAMDRQGNPGVVLHPDRWDYGTVAHEAAHHAANGPERFNDASMTDEDIHGPRFAQAYGRTLGVVSRGAGEDFARHHADARREVSDYRARVHGLPRIDGQGQLERDAALQYKNPEDHPFFQANPVSKDNIKHAWDHHTTPDERDQASRWYPDAHLVATSIAHGNAALGAGMLSAYSPLTRWPANMFNAARSIHEGRAMGTRKGDGAIMRVHWQPAQRILAGEHHSQVFNPKTAMKTHAFAHLIEHGGNTDEDLDAGTAHVVVDRHALSVAVGRRVTDEEYGKAPVSKYRYYHHVAKQYTDAARDISEETGKRVDPATVQAGTWLAQVRRNEAEDSTMRGRLGRGRITRGHQDVQHWQDYAHQHHPDLSGETMHLGALQMMGGDPPLRVPPSVDTLRPEACPVCGNSDVFKGQRCPVCGFVSPPDIFRDPDIDQARANRQALEEGAETSPYPEGPADEEQMTAGAEPGMNPEQIGSGQDAGDQLMHPDQIAPDGVPGVQPEGAPGQGMLEPSGEQEQPADEEGGLAGPGELDENGQPVAAQEGEEEIAGANPEGAAVEEDAEAQEDEAMAEQLGAKAEGEEETAGEEEGGSPGKEQDEDERPGGKMPKRSAAIAARNASDNAVAELRQENAVLRRQLQFVAELAGIGPELDEIRRQADLANPAQPVPDPPQEPPTSTTEQALMTGAPTGGGSGTARGPGHTEDDPSRPGTTPGSLTAVPAEQTTTAITPGVEIPTAPASQLTDVTAPIQGTNPSQDGGVPMEQRRIETDVRVNPNPLAAQGPGIGGQGNDGTSFPWTIGARQVLGGPASAEDERGARTMASIRLARLQVQAGLARGDELEVGSAIEANASLSLRDIEHEIDTITRMAKATAQAQPRYPRNLAPRQAARSAPSFAGPPAPVMAMTAAADTGGDDSDLFID